MPAFYQGAGLRPSLEEGNRSPATPVVAGLVKTNNSEPVNHSRLNGDSAKRRSQDEQRKPELSTATCHAMSHVMLLPIAPVAEFGLLFAVAGTTIDKATARATKWRCCNDTSSPLQKAPGVPATAAMRGKTWEQTSPWGA